VTTFSFWRVRAVRLALALLAALALLPAAVAQGQRVEAVQVELVASRAHAVAGQGFEVGLRIRHDPHWHTYWRHPGDSGLATRLDWTLPPRWQAGDIGWPAPRRLLIGPLASYAYEGEVVLPVMITVPADQPPGQVELAVDAQWLMCRDVCIPGQARVSLPVQVRAGGEAAPTAHRALFDQARARQPAGVLRARVTRAGDRLVFGFEHPSLARAEFFPYREALVAQAADQVLYRVGAAAAGRYRLEIPVPDGLAPSVLPPGLDGGRPVGLLILDDQVLELATTVAPGPDPGPGEVVSRAVGVQLLGAGGLSGAGSSGAGAGSRLTGVAGGAGSAPADPAGGASGPVDSLWLAALLGALGGLILNLMPCVFPVIGLKVMGFAGQGLASPGGAARARWGALAFSAGVMLSFLGLAGLLLALRAAGQSVGWGFQLQSPVFVAAMALLFVLVALNFAGVYEFGAAFTRLGQHEATLAARGGGGGLAQHAGSFGSGVLAVLVATPCTAPFMGSALGYTLGQPAAAVLLVFAAIAFGMALPYLVLGFVPRLLSWLPRPGRWMESLRQFLAFPMLATAAWLSWVLGQQAGIDAVLALALGAVLVALAAWLFGRFVQGRGRAAGLAALLAVAALGAGCWLALSQAGEGVPPAAAGPGAITSARGSSGAAGEASASAAASASGNWEPWSEQRVEQALAEGRPVFIDFTAAWCVSCQANKRLALDRAAVRAAFDRARVVRLRADWTHRDPAITAALARHGRNGVPLYLLHVPGRSQPLVLPELLTPGLVLEALARAGLGL
jgi:thiol:disulfide interchange protein DsbD